ncbi:DNA excision repair protein ERCC-1 isoform X2 [Phalaenopsis equestris]|uniref:DNA excision repair protein ERCC-1 isoform X2 n=1 Tax=Phalaenopsis equestris TaxID=78828 RepID=UPI0009E5423F|nr:DNA excision repair protein ERCC-1 isoform X2 [Phalaenopsis equestris]
MEKTQDDEPNERRTEKKGLIQIPSYQEVFGISGGDGSSSSRSYNPPPPASFSQAFSFIKSSEFYSPPPPLEQAPREVSDSAAASCSSSYTPISASNSYSSASSSAQNRNAILVSHRQKGNPLLKHIRNVKWAFADIVCDYLLGQSSCALYISLRYHLLHPEYLYYRIRELQKVFKLRVILCHIDVEDVVKPLLEVTKTAMFHDCSLLCGWSLEECGRYLETIKVYENKPADSIREQTDTDYLSRLTRALTTVRHVNKTDVVTLGSTFGSLAGIMDASMEDLARCPGIGERKFMGLSYVWAAHVGCS